MICYVCLFLSRIQYSKWESPHKTPRPFVIVKESIVCLGCRRKYMYFIKWFVKLYYLFPVWSNCRGLNLYTTTFRFLKKLDWKPPRTPSLCPRRPPPHHLKRRSRRFKKRRWTPKSRSQKQSLRPSPSPSTLLRRFPRRYGNDVIL